MIENISITEFFGSGGLSFFCHFTGAWCGSPVLTLRQTGVEGGGAGGGGGGGGGWRVTIRFHLNEWLLYSPTDYYYYLTAVHVRRSFSFGGVCMCSVYASLTVQWRPAMNCVCVVKIRKRVVLVGEGGGLRGGGGVRCLSPQGSHNLVSQFFRGVFPLNSCCSSSSLALLTITTITQYVTDTCGKGDKWGTGLEVGSWRLGWTCLHVWDRGCQ